MAKVPAKRWDTREDVLLRLEEARQAMENEPGKWSLDQLAEIASQSPHHFHRLFRQTYGVTPLMYLRECRLKRAHLLLALKQMGVHEACIEVGFSSLGSFSRLYKSRFGYPPSQTPAKWSSQDRTSVPPAGGAF